jgi:hypothetical protein
LRPRLRSKSAEKRQKQEQHNRKQPLTLDTIGISAALLTNIYLDLHL